MASKTTPGPWRWGRTTVNTGTGAHEGDMQLRTDMVNPALNDPIILTVREDWTRHLLTHPEGQANARLIAKAPELREALRAYIDRCDRIGLQPGIFTRAEIAEVEAARALLAEIDGKDQP